MSVPFDVVTVVTLMFKKRVNRCVCECVCMCVCVCVYCTQAYRESSGEQPYVTDAPSRPCKTVQFERRPVAT